MKQPTASKASDLQVEPLKRVAGLRVWVKDEYDFPVAAARLLQVASRLDITPMVMLFDIADDDWSVVLLADR